MERVVWEIFVLLLFSLASECGGISDKAAEEPRKRHLFVQRSQPLPGSSKKLLKIEYEEPPRFSAEQEEPEFLRRVRRSVDPDMNPQAHVFRFNDSHYHAYVHWAGDHRDTIVVLMRDPIPTARSNSHVWISRNYGQSFVNRTGSFRISNGFARIDMFYPSPLDNTRYLFVDRQHQMIYSTLDDCQTVINSSVPFVADEITFHSTIKDVVVAYDASAKKLYYSADFGFSWNLKDENVVTYFWGIPPWDNPNTLYIEREEYAGGYSNVVKTDYFSHFSALLITHVEDFEVIDNYMFATQVNTSSGRRVLTLMVSVNRSDFHPAEIPSDAPSQDFYVVDASENQVFLAVTHDRRTTHLYISGTSGRKYSLSLERVLYFSPNTTTAWLRRYIDFSFVDLHKVQGLRGVYIASQLTVGAVGTRRIMTKITFDKGGMWQPVSAPKYDNHDKPLNCSLPNCSLHLSQKFGQYYPYTRYSPMKSWTAAPGIIMATGTYGKNLRLNSDIFLSTDAGLNWHMILKRPFWWYNLGDHGGIFIAVQRSRLTNLIYYSWNEGETWLTYRFLNSTRMRVYGLLTEPGEQSAEFTLYGSYPGYHRWVVVQINLRKALGSPCLKDKDYKPWIPSDERNGTCLLGRKTIYERRISHAHCYNGYDYDRPISSQNCLCDKEDFECDVGYIPDAYNPDKCVFDRTSGLSPTSMPAYCPPGSTYRRTKGYRKVAGDTCSGGMEDHFSAVMVSCRIGPQPQFLLYAGRRFIRRISLGDNRETTIPLGSGLQNVIALDYDYAQNCIYWADITLDTIKRSFLNGSGIIETLHGGIQQVEGLALDWLADNIYWIDAVGKKLEVSRADGRFRKVIISNLDRPRAIVLDPVAGYMYWTDWGTHAKIERSYMTGAGRAAIVSSGLQWPNGIAIDFVARKLYWTDAGKDRIERSNLDGSYRQVITSRGLPHPYSISVFKDSIYWDDWSTQSIKKANKRDGGARQTIKSGVRGLMDVKVFHEDAQIGNNSCSQLKICSHLCLAVPNSYACACPDNMRTVTSVSGIVTCECQTGEYMDSNGECTTRTGTCDPNEFKCTNSRCIPSHWKCDHDNDCGDNSDEQNCPYDTCSSTQFTCDNGRCISASWKCDHDDDCHDMSDERNCAYPSCGPDKFTCDNKRCIPNRWRCDFDDDCRDGSDERGCTPAPVTTVGPASCHSSQFACNNGRCIPGSWKCDGDQDCGDGSDEPSSCSKRRCTSTQFNCTNGRCIPRSWKCDGENDCGDGSDEQGCTYTTRPPVSTIPWTPSTNCSSWEYQCNNRHCIFQWDVCDGVNDCGDNSDEWYCGTTRRPSVNTTTSPHRPCHFWEFTCDSGQCINNGYKCNGRDDCGDNSDERGCSAHVSTVAPSTAPAPCPNGWLHCGQTQFVICIKTEWLCDGQPNCPQSWDERPENCPKTTRVPITCSSDQYQCTNGGCLPRSFVCDGRDQCGDGSDEAGCGTCSGFWCDKTQCLPVSRRCDHIPDCLDGSDERNCSTNLQVKGVQVSTLSATSVHITWRPISYQPPGMTFTGYRVSYRAVRLHSVPVSGSWQQEESPNVNYYVIRFLQPCSEYEFKVQLLVSGAQPGPYSSTVKTTTKSIRTSKPQHVRLLLAPDDSLLVSWDPPTTYCHLITNYEVAYKMTSEANFHTKETGNVYSLSLNLTQGVHYSIKVKAFTGDKGGDGDGEYSKVQPVYIPTVVQKPTAPVKKPHYTFLNDTAVTLVWGSPTHPVLGYKVYELTTDGSILLVTTSQHNYTVYSLLSHSTYSFVIKPYNKAGEGPPATIEVTTNGGNPPTDVKATPYNDTSIILSWYPPRGYSQGLRYYIFYGRVTTGVSSRPVGSTTTQRYVVNNLQQEIVYVFEVSVGLSGKHSEAANSRTKTKAVHSLQARLVNSSSVVLTWEVPVNVDVSKITGYQLTRTYREKSGTDTATRSTNQTTYEFRYLPFDTIVTFEVKVKYGNRLGTGISTTKKTNPFTASVRPLRIRVVNDVVELFWSAPRTISNSALKHYQVNWTCPSCVTKHGTKTAPTTSCVFKQLEHSRKYTFSVKAVTKFGVGEASIVTATITRNFGAVGRLRQVVSGNNLTLDWDVPSDVEKKDVQVYQISWCEIGDYSYCWHTNSTNSTGNATQFMTQVLAGYTYTFYVQAYTAYGKGRASSIQVIVPPLSLMVWNCRGTRTGGNHGLEVSLTWRPPWSARPGDKIQYEVEWRCSSGSGRGYCYWFYARNSIVVNTTSAKLNMTSFGVTYMFKITPTIPSRGKGKPYSLAVTMPDFTASIGNFACWAESASNGTRLECHWSRPTGFDPSRFYHYDFKYRCDDCLYGHIVYKSIRSINQTSVSIYVDKGQQYTLWNRAHASYGYGTQAQTTVLIGSTLRPVRSLKAVIDPKKKTLVHLSWNAPINTSVKFYILVTDCPDCVSFTTIRTQLKETKYAQTLQCGNKYTFTVRAQTTADVLTQESNDTLEIASPVGKVENFSVKSSDTHRDNSTHRGDMGAAKCSVMKWAPPKENDSSSAQWTGYQIAVRTADALKNFVKTTKVSKETQNYSVCDHEDNELKAGKEYIFEIRVIVPCGFGATAMLRARLGEGEGYIPATAAPPSAGKQTGGEKKGMSPVIWAVPVAVVGLILVLVMTYFVRKSRRLERSMFALMTRRTIDDEGGVTFHSDEDVPFIQGFSDDEPLVTA